MNSLKRLAITAMALATADAFAAKAIVHLSHDASRASPENIVDITVKNTSDHDLYVLGYHSILEKPEGRTTSNWLTIHDSFGRKVPYVGRYVKDGAFPASAFLRIEPGASIDGSVSLSREYDLPPAGEVRVSTSVSVFDRVPAMISTSENEPVDSESITSNELTFPIVGGYVRPATVASTLQCTAGQLSDTRSAITAAQVASQEAVNFLGSLYYVDHIDPENPDPQPPRIHMKPHRRYTNWFGTWDEWAPQPPDMGWEFTDNSLVDQVTTAVYARLLFGATAVCDECKGYSPSSRAWAEGALIHLCPVNFTDPITGGTTSQSGTIIHEVSHRNDSYAEGTVDYNGVRDRNSARSLPRHQAVRSAANYEYFITGTQLGR